MLTTCIPGYPTQPVLCLNPGVTIASAPPPDDVEALRAALLAEQTARRHAEQRASGAEAVIAHLKLLIAKMRHERFGASSERGRKLLDQLELQLEEIETTTAEDDAAVEAGTAPDDTAKAAATRRKPVRAPFPAHLPRERVVIPGPTACPCCNGRLARLGEEVTETLEVIPRQWMVIQTVRERFACRACEAITQMASTVPRHPARPRRTRAAGDDPGGQVRPAPAAQPAERDVCP